jgi:hypothetical protein
MNSPLETYLDELNKGLKALPIHERLEQIDEARAHLEGLRESYQELGHESDEAERQAITQFGQVKAVSQELTKNTKRPALFHTLGLGAIFTLVVGALQGVLGIFLLGTDIRRVLDSALDFGFGPGYPTSFMLCSALSWLAAGPLFRRLAPGNTLRPLLFICALQLFLAGAALVKGLLGFNSVNSFNFISFFPQGVLLSFFTSGAIREIYDAFQQRRRVLA